MNDLKQKMTNLTYEMRQYWDPLLNRLSHNIYFCAKLAARMRYQHAVTPEYVVRVFPSELRREELFFELVDSHQNLLDPNDRVLYRLARRDDWEQVYPLAEGENRGDARLVPLTALEEVNRTPGIEARPRMPEPPQPDPEPAPPTPPAKRGRKPGKKAADAVTTVPAPVEPRYVELPYVDETAEDAHFNQMTLRDYYCITQNVPLSRRPWLNELITQGVQFKQSLSL